MLHLFNFLIALMLGGTFMEPRSAEEKKREDGFQIACNSVEDMLLAIEAATEKDVARREQQVVALMRTGVCTRVQISDRIKPITSIPIYEDRERNLAITLVNVRSSQRPLTPLYGAFQLSAFDEAKKDVPIRYTPD